MSSVLLPNFYKDIKFDADIKEWSQADVLTHEEAASLCLAKNPKYINVTSLQDYQHSYGDDTFIAGGSTFIKRYSKVIDFISRAFVDEKTLSMKDFLKWVFRYDDRKFFEMEFLKDLAEARREDKLDPRLAEHLLDIVSGLMISKQDYEGYVEGSNSSDSSNYKIANELIDNLSKVGITISYNTIDKHFKRSLIQFKKKLNEEKYQQVVAKEREGKLKNG